MGDRARAERVYEKLLDAEPKSTDALRGLASLAIQSSDFDAALEYHVRLIDLGERSAELLYNTGLMYEKADQSEKAAHLYREALALQPGMPEALLNLGRILESGGNSDEARLCWTKALEAEPALAQRLLRTRHGLSPRRLAGESACPTTQDQQFTTLVGQAFSCQGLFCCERPGARRLWKGFGH